MNKFLIVLIFSVLFIDFVKSIDKIKDCNCWVTRDFKTRIGSYPWIVNLYENGVFKCSGTIVNENYVLFSKNCAQNFNGNYSVTVGEIKQNEKLEKLSNSIQVKNIKIRTSTDSIGIAMLELASPIEFTNNLKPSCLEQETRKKSYFLPFHLVGFNPEKMLKEISYQDISEKIGNCPENIICAKKRDENDLDVEFNSSGLAQNTIDGRTTIIGIIDENDKKQMNLIRIGKHFDWILRLTQKNICYIY